MSPYERNPRTHSDAQVDQIAASMVNFGAKPVLIDEQGGVLTGHGCLLAARKLGLAEVPVLRFEHLSEPQRYLIADNQLALQAGWSEELLAQELGWLIDENLDLDLVGFEAAELERLVRWRALRPRTRSADRATSESSASIVRSEVADYANAAGKAARKRRPILKGNLSGGFTAFLYGACVNILSVTKRTI